jgi:hypothetical protein
LVNGANGLVVIFAAVQESRMVLLSFQGFAIKCITVVTDVSSQLVQAFGKLVPAGNQHSVDVVLPASDVDLCAADFLFQVCHNAHMLI